MKMIKFIFIILLSVFSLQALAYDLPDIGNSSGGVISPIEEQELGKQYFQAIRQQMPLIRDPYIVNYIQQLGSLLAKNSNNPKQHFYFFVVNDSVVNAFAGPDGYIGVNSGLILTAKSEGELAAVLAHEISHVTQRHIARSIAQAKRLQIADIAGVLAGIAVGMNNPQAGAGLASAASAGALQKSLNNSRAYEEEADRFGMQTLARAGYDPKYMPEFFERLESIARINGGDDDTYALLMTHPVTSARIADADNRLSQFQVINPRPNNSYFYLIQARALALTTRDPLSLSQTLSYQVSQNPNNISLRYAYALSLIQANQLPSASIQVQQLLAKDPKNALFLAAQAQLLQSQKKGGAAIDVLNKIQQQSPSNLPDLLQYAQTLLQNQQYEKARQILSQNQLKYAGNTDFLSLLSQAQGRSGHIVEAYETRAKMMQLNNDIPGAIIQLQQADRFSKDKYEKARIAFEMSQLKRDQRYEE